MNVLYILLGWLFGILSPRIVSYISNHYKKIALQRIIVEELKDIKRRLVFIPLTVYPSYGHLEIKHYLWIKEQTNNFTELMSDEKDKKKLKKMLEQDNKAENIVKLFNINKISDNPAFNFKKIETSIIDSNQNNFDIIDNQFLTKILEIKFQIGIYNEEIRTLNEFLKMTFDSNITETNHQIIKKQIETKNYFIAEKAMFVVKKINKIINKLNNK